MPVSASRGLLAAAALFLVNIFFGTLLKSAGNHLPPLTAMGASFIVGGVAAFFVALIFEKKLPSIPKKLRKQAFFIILGLAVVHICVMMGALLLPVGIFSTLTLLELFFSLLFLSRLEPVRPIRWAGGICIIVGGITALLPVASRIEEGHLFWWGVFSVLMMCILAPINNIFQKSLLHRMPLFSWLALRSIFAGSILLCISVLLEGPTHLSLLFHHWHSVALVGIAIFFFQKTAFLFAMKHLGVGRTLAFATAATPFTFIAGSWFFSEPVFAISLLGAGIAAVGTVLSIDNAAGT